MTDLMRQMANEKTPGTVECHCCKGTGRMVRDPDIGTDQECFCLERLAAMTQELGELKSAIKDGVDGALWQAHIEREAELAASHLREKQLRDALSCVLNGDVGKQVLWKLESGQGKDTDDGRAWLRASALCLNSNDTSALDALLKDAARYDTARAAFTNGGLMLNGEDLADVLFEQGTPEKFDAAIDAAVKSNATVQATGEGFNSPVAPATTGYAGDNNGDR